MFGEIDNESILAAGSEAVSRESLDDVLVCEDDLSNDEPDVQTNELRWCGAHSCVRIYVYRVDGDVAHRRIKRSTGLKICMR